MSVLIPHVSPVLRDRPGGARRRIHLCGAVQHLADPLDSRSGGSGEVDVLDEASIRPPPSPRPRGAQGRNSYSALPKLGRVGLPVVEVAGRSP